MTKQKKAEEYEQLISELTQDLQRTRADFENYRKRMESEKQAARQAGETKAILKLLAVIDTIERAVANVPADLANNPWARGIAGIDKQLAKQLAALGVKKIAAAPGTIFNPELHQAVQFDEESEGDSEVVTEEMQAGYTLNGVPIRHAMVRVMRR